MAAILATCLLLGGWPLRVLIGLAALLGLWEFGQMFWPGFSNLPDKLAGYAAGLSLVLFGAFAPGTTWAAIILGALAFYVALRFLIDYGRGNDEARLARHAIILFGVMYLPLSLQLALHISLQEQFLIILAAVGSDSGAYYAGTHLGKHKIWPRVSPKKSWEGALGGICSAMLILAVYGSLVAIPLLEQLAFWQWALVGLALSLAAQAGDFFESALKRSVGIKDSSKLIPGHGGLLDRLDSIVFVLPVYLFIRMLAVHAPF